MELLLCCRSIPEKHPVQTMALAYWSFHYAKRIFETFCVHRCDRIIWWHSVLRHVPAWHFRVLPKWTTAAVYTALDLRH